jgi:hypothetical protein
MNALFDSRRLIAASLCLLLASACESLGAPPAIPHTPTPAAEQGAETPAVLVFPTAAPATQLPDVPPSANLPITATLAAPASSSVPVVQFVSPITNTQISISQTIYTVTYAASDSGIARIELYDDNVLVRAERAPSPAPPVFSAIIPWTPNQIGYHTLRVVAFDAMERASASDESLVAVTPNTRRPTAVLLYPLGVPQIEVGGIFQLQAVAIDETGVTQLDLFVDNQLHAYVPSPNAGGQTIFPATFHWNALTPGAHTLFLRAHDTQDQTNDSPPLRVTVNDSRAPVLSVAFDRTSAQTNEPISITITALDVAGVQRVELWVGRETANVTTSSSPARQTTLSAQVLWQSANPGDYEVFARAYNAGGGMKESPRQTISILRAGQSAPTPAPSATPSRTRAPRPTATPRLQPPPPPSAELIAPSDKFSASSPLRITLGGKGNAELDHLEVWGYYHGQPSPLLLCVVDARNTTQKTALCDWNAPDAGIVYLFAQAIDIYRQSGRSPIISGYIAVPAPPTATPPPVSVAGRWTAPTFAATLRQTGATVRGEFKMAASGTTEVEGRVTSGAIKGDRVSFRVEFALPGTETAALPAMDFDCALDAATTTLTCSWRDARGRSGSALFRRESGS